MPEQGAQDKTEKPTPRRRSKAREQGQVAKSQEIGSVGVLLGGLMSLWLFGGFFYDQMASVVTQILSKAPSTHLTEESVHHLAMWMMQTFAISVAPFMLTVLALGVIVNFLQVGFMISPKRLKPELKRLNPIEGAKKFFSMRIAVDLFKNVGKLLVVGFVAYNVMRQEWDRLPQISNLEISVILMYLMGVCLKIFFWCLLAMLVLAILDYAYQKWDFEKNLKMSKQEIKDEFKQTEGDPQVKSRIRTIQREQARKRMMGNVPDADVVITNPTHYAVAIKYEAGEMDAPEVVAKGMNKVAQRIKDIARENEVPIIEDPPLAQALYKAVEVGQSIPIELYEAVASILAHVYRLKNKHRRVLDTIGAGQAQRMES